MRTVAPRALRSESDKLGCESLYYSCQVCSNHVRYFNKREQQREKPDILSYHRHCRRHPRRPSPRLSTYSILPRRNPLANLLFPPTSLSLTFLLTIYIYIATSGDPVTVSIRALSRDAEILRPAGINGNSDFSQVSTILANRPRADLSEEFICPGSHSLPLSLVSFSTNSSLGKTEALVNESVQFRRSEPRAFEIAL